MIERMKVGDPEQYKGRTIQATYCGPDCLCLVDGREVGNFYMTAEAARTAGRRYIDELERER